MTEQYVVAPGHRLPDEEWAAVVRRAEEVQRELAAAAQGGAAGPAGMIVDMTARGVASKKFFGVSGIPTQLLVLHSAECPLQAGYAVSLSEWASGTVYPAPPIASWHRFIDPVHRVRLIPDELGAWHASEANVLSIGWEQAGYARFGRAEWLTSAGVTQLELLAFDMAEVAVRDGIPARWLSTAEVRAVLDSGNRSIKGFCTHRQIDPETRTDPGNGYPYDLLMERIRFYMSGEPEDDFMALTADEQRAILTAANRVNSTTGRILTTNDLPAIADAVLDRGVRDEATGNVSSLRTKVRWLKHEQNLDAARSQGLAEKLDEVLTALGALDDALDALTPAAPPAAPEPPAA